MMEKTFAAVGALCALIIALGLAIAAIIWASHPPADVNVYFDRDGRPVKVDPLPYTPYQPAPAPQPYYPHRPGQNETGAKTDA